MTDALMRGVLSLSLEESGAASSRLYHLCSQPTASRNIGAIAEHASGHLIVELAKQLRQLPAFPGDSECGASLLQLVAGLAGAPVREKK